MKIRNFHLSKLCGGDLGGRGEHVIKMMTSLTQFLAVSVQLLLQYEFDNVTVRKSKKNKPTLNKTVFKTVENQFGRYSPLCQCSLLTHVVCVQEWVWTIVEIMMLTFSVSLHCVKSIRIRSYSGPYSVRMRENTDQNNSEYGLFSRSVSKWHEERDLTKTWWSVT